MAFGASLRNKWARRLTWRSFFDGTLRAPAYDQQKMKCVLP